MALLKRRRRRQARGFLDRLGFTKRKRFVFFRFTPQGRAARPFFKRLGI